MLQPTAMARKKPTGVRGPNSALTEFLRVEGITDAFRRRQERSESVETSDFSEETEPPSGPSGTATATAEVRAADPDEDAIREAGRRKRAGNYGSDDSDDDWVDTDNPTNRTQNKFGEISECADCGKPFTLTVYSRYLAARKGYLCDECNELVKEQERASRRSQFAARKRRKKVALALLDRTRVRIPKLQDVCIRKITENIGDVDALGDIGQANINKVAQILSKNRSLDDSTIPLFLNPTITLLRLWDCSNVDSDSLNKIVAFCPKLQSLTLFMCGQFHNDNLEYYGTNLTELTSLALNGPFLISESAWLDYFAGGGSRLSEFELRNTHRFGNDSLISLLEGCGSSLTSLKLSRLDGLKEAAVYGLIPHYLLASKLVHLELSYPHAPGLITDDLIINILSVTGDTLVSLNVDGCTDLTDRFLTEGVAKFCPRLTHLSMDSLDQVSNEGFSAAFDDYSKVNSGGLIGVNLRKCGLLANEAVYSLLKHSGKTLVELNLNSLRLLTKDLLIDVLLPRKVDQDSPFDPLELPLLTTLDIGFVRVVDNMVLLLLGQKCPKLAILEIYGDNRCTKQANVRSDLLVIGRQSDTA